MKDEVMGIFIIFGIVGLFIILFTFSNIGKNTIRKQEAASKAIRERNRRDKELALEEEKEKKAKINLNKNKENDEKNSKLKRELELLNTVYLEKEIEQQKLIEKQNKIKEEENKKIEKKKLEKLRKLNFEEIKKKKEELEREIGFPNEINSNVVTNNISINKSSDQIFESLNSDVDREKWREIAQFYNNYETNIFGDEAKKEKSKKQIEDIVNVLLKNLMDLELLDDKFSIGFILSCLVTYELVKKDQFLSVQEELKDLKSVSKKINLSPQLIKTLDILVA